MRIAAPEAADEGLQQLQTPGRIRVAVYKDFPPYSDAGEGIDVDIAKALAARLGVALDLMWVQASDESMEDDLRNAVWKGHYLGGGTADVMLHVPVDPQFAARNDKVKITGAYHRESLQIAHNTAKLPELASVDDLGRQAGRRRNRDRPGFVSARRSGWTPAADRGALSRRVRRDGCVAQG